MFLTFRRVCESDEEANLQKRFKQDLCPQEDRPRIPPVLLRSDFCSLEGNYLSFSQQAKEEEEAPEPHNDKPDKIEAAATGQVALPGFEDMTLELIGSSDFRQNKDIIKRSLLPSESSLDGSLRFIHTANPDEISLINFSQEEPFCPQVSSTEVLKVKKSSVSFLWLHFCYFFSVRLTCSRGKRRFCSGSTMRLNPFSSLLLEFLFTIFVNIVFHPKTSIYRCYFTETTVEFLKEFANAGTKIKRMREFTKSNILSFSNPQQTRQTPTMMSFSQSLDRALASLKKKVLKMPSHILEGRSVRRGEMFLESQLYTTHISPLEVLGAARVEIFPEVNSLYDFCSFIVEQDQGVQQTSAQMLSRMYEYLKATRVMSQNKHILRIFVDAIKPFHHTLSNFLTSGEAMDPCNEFFVEKSTFFDRGEAFVPTFIAKYARQIKEIGFMFNLLGLDHNDSLGGVPNLINITDSPVEDSPNIPPTSLIPQRKQRTFEDIVKESQVDIGKIFDRPRSGVENMLAEMSIKPRSSPEDDECDLFGENIECMDVEDVVDALFCTAVEENYARTGAAAVDVLNSKWHMRHHVQAVKRYLLMEAGDFSGELCERIFSFHSEYTDYQWILEETDRECLWVDEYRKNLCFVVSDGEKHPIDSIKYLDFLSLTYTVGDGKDPLTRILFTRENMKKYESVWKFLLRMKRALFLLKEAWVSTKRAPPRALFSPEEASSECRTKKSRIVLYSMDRLLKDVEMYFYHEGLYAPWVTFAAALDSARNVDALVRCHAAFLDEMLSRCFLVKKYAPISRIFSVLIDVAIKFAYVCEEDESRWAPLNEKFRDTVRTLYEILSKVNEGKTRYDLSLSQLLHVLELVSSSP